VRTLLIIFAMLVFLITSCMKEKEFPIEPVITFKSFTKVFNPPDTIPAELVLSITFTDGDGDIGLYDDENNPPYDVNLFIELYKRVNNQHELIIFPDTTFNFNGRIPLLNEGEDENPIEGVIEYAFDYKLLRSFLLNDTIAFDVSIQDRALNRSNMIRTPDLIVE
jgi:hypothetical protein